MSEDIENNYEKFHYLTDRYSKLIYRICWRHSSGDDELFQEMVQDCYVSIWFHLSSLKTETSRREILSWVSFRCRSALSHRLRKKVFVWQPFDIDMVDSLPDTSSAENRELLESLAVDLNDTEKDTLMLILEGYSRQEIADRLGLSLESVKTIKKHIIKKMTKSANEQ